MNIYIKDKTKKIIMYFVQYKIISEKIFFLNSDIFKYLKIHLGKEKFIYELKLQQEVLKIIEKSKNVNDKKFAYWVINELIPNTRIEYTNSISDELKKQCIVNSKLNTYFRQFEELSLNQILYIATTDSYSKNNYYKVGGTLSEQTIKGRLSTYNTGRPPNDQYYFVDVFYCHNYKTVEKRIAEILGKFKLVKEKEMFHINYNHLKNIINQICENHKSEILFINSIGQKIINDSVHYPSTSLNKFDLSSFPSLSSKNNPKKNKKQKPIKRLSYKKKLVV